MTAPPSVPSWVIDPVGPLHGDVRISGSKNAVSKLMVAALLARESSTITNAPRIGDVEITAGMLRSVGGEVDIAGDTVTIDPDKLGQSRIPVSYSGLNRMSILLVGPLLHRIGEAFVPFVGGDRIGPRPVDFHVEALRQFGAEVEITDEGLEAKAVALHGARIRLPWPSVGATETVLMTAALAEGRTILENAAIEPEVVELALFLQRMGARIELQPDRRFVVEGVPHLTGADQRLGGDRIEAFSYLVAGLATGGSVRITGCAQERLVTAITTLQRMGASFRITDDTVTAWADRLRPCAVRTSPHPGFMTDWQPPLIVLCTRAHGMSVVHETLFEDRLGYIDALQLMQAEVELFEQCLVGDACRFAETGALHSALVRGVSPLEGAEVEMPDIRAAFAYVIAAAAAGSSSVLHGVHHLERGYDHVFEKFSELGLGIRQLSA
ncbi:MAG TPA: UDP-N-acetylglucosamine 1-carboxyvinyltransferase [Acidimicrobiales bacterium]|nr:UDP-N-acetylglucosamine 1-carboxyvinyltransferase [Acidimicrobiales bacterium]